MSLISRWQQRLQQLGSLPEPSPDAWATSDALSQQIQRRQQQAPLTFADFMQQALYAPGLGYYSAGATKFGAAGDFITAPELSPLFGQVLARQCQRLLSGLPADTWLIEVGAGSGALAEALLLELQASGQLPVYYGILELSADLRQRQQQRLQQSLPEFYDRIRWLDRLPSTPLNAVVLANEVLDAMPVELWRWQHQQLQQAWVIQNEQGFALDWQPPTPALRDWFAQTQQPAQLPDGYQSEACLLLSGWIDAWGQCLQQGGLLLIDYGFGRPEYYHPERSSGTLMCHYRHRAQPDPLILTGLQDITAHVDFTATAEAGLAAGFELEFYTTQADFLLAGGLLDLFQQLPAKDQLRAAHAVKLLTLPHEMGELFKVMLLGKVLPDYGELLCQRDVRHRL